MVERIKRRSNADASSKRRGNNEAEIVDMTLDDDTSSGDQLHSNDADGNNDAEGGRHTSKRQRLARVVSEGEASESDDESDESTANNSRKRSSSSRKGSSKKRSREKDSRNGRRVRKSEPMVNFADVQAQEREMSKIKYAQKQKQQSVSNASSSANTASAAATTTLRKGVHSASPRTSSSSKRSWRQARLRMSPRSPADDPRLGIRKGAPMVDLDDLSSSDALRKRRFANNAEAIKDAVLHSTAWRNKKLDVAPSNILADEPGISVPFAMNFDAPLSAFDPSETHELATKCAVASSALTRPKPLMLATGSPAEASRRTVLETRIGELVDEALPLIKAAHTQRVRTIMANMRQQVRSYLSQLPQHREKVQDFGGLFRPLQISRLEKVATRTILKNVESPKDVGTTRYTVGRGETSLSEREVFPGRVIHLSKIASLSRSTTCMGTRGAIRVEDDPIIRFVPLFTDNNKAADNRYEEQFDGFGGGRKGFLSVLDDETKEYLLRYVVAACDGDSSVFDVLKEQGIFTQPRSDYVDICNREVRHALQQKRLEKLGKILKADSENPVAAGYMELEKNAIHKLIHEYTSRASGRHLRDRLEHPPTHFELYHLSTSGCSQQSATSNLGLKATVKDSYRDMARRYQDFFCRRCFVYNCLHHGINHPIPSIRSDPKYPAVKASRKLHRQVEARTDLVSLEEVDEDAVPTVGGDQAASNENSSHEENGSESVQDENTGESNVDENESEENGRRRSVRSLTAASTKASSALLSQRPKEKKKTTYFRTKLDRDADVSEYLGQDAVYRLVTKEKRALLLAPDQVCGDNCSKTSQASNEVTGRDGPASSWSAAEVLLVKKVEKSLGVQPCITATILATKSCSEVAEFFRQRREEQESDALIGYYSMGGHRDHERPLGARGNNHEHLRRTRHQRMKDRGANHEYVPCNHDGVSWCKCDPGECRSASCPCFFAGRECIPDLCFSCGACEVPLQTKDPDCTTKWRELTKTCGNINILRGCMRRVGVAASDTHGWGAFALEDMKKGDFIYEYTGDLLSQDEAERRGNSYDKNSVSFLFDLNEDTVVDATRKGNKSKFANHTSTEPKCVARIMRVNGEHRIGIYANVDIAAHEELFFDYGYNGVVPDWSQSRIGTGNVKASDVVVIDDEKPKEPEKPATEPEKATERKEEKDAVDVPMEDVELEKNESVDEKKAEQ
uniref:SET domain-containing protein n=1 Tax=Globisporangium ultimum (strain ATCC 200006 / CBS 805.95 / DAOM BR144) TaxID=431595 RepID=K3X153_GLOUD